MNPIVKILSVPLDSSNALTVKPAFLDIGSVTKMLIVLMVVMRRIVKNILLTLCPILPCFIKMKFKN